MYLIHPGLIPAPFAFFDQNLLDAFILTVGAASADELPKGGVL